jgi:hypothetical protein
MNVELGIRNSGINFLYLLFKHLVLVALVIVCAQPSIAGANQDSQLASLIDTNYPGVPQSAIYSVAIVEHGRFTHLPVFENACPRYEPGYMNMKPVDQYPLRLFRGRTINWVNFSFSGRLTIQVRITDRRGTQLDGPVKIFPAKAGVIATVDGKTATFILTQPGQYSVEIGVDGYKNGLLIFANPPEKDRPNPASENYFILTNATASVIDAVPASFSGLYFRSGVHDIGVYQVPACVKNIYLEPGAWVYGALVIDKNPGLRIFGRGVLSGAKLNYRQSHMVEAVRSDGIYLEGIIIADTKYYAVRLLGRNNMVNWVKIVGGWTYNTDGIAAFAGSRVAHCFVWANDDALKPYRSNLTISDCVIWQLNNGAVVQLGWGNAKATNVVISNVDVLRAEWNNNAVNRGIVSCVGDKFSKGGMSGSHCSFLIEDLVTETPVPFIFNVRPGPTSPEQIHGMYFRNWNIAMDLNCGYPNRIEGTDPSAKFDGFVFDHFKLNGVELTESNWIRAGHFVITNLVAPKFL